NPMVMGPFNAAMGLSGQLQQSGQNAVNAGAAGWGQAQGYASQLQSLAGLLSHEFDFNLPYAKQALESGFDPMNAQHDYYQREAMNQMGAEEANSGLGGTPYAAAIFGSTNAAFNNQWEMQRLQRQAIGAQTADTLEGRVQQAQMGAGQLIDAAGNL